MLVLTIRTDKPESEIGLFEDSKKIAYITWEAHRELSVTIHKKILELLESQRKTLHDLHGIVCFKGPGSFTGLRIGLTMANTLAAELEIPIVGASGKEWLKEGMDYLVAGNTEQLVLPEYGGGAHITAQKK